MYRKAMRGRTLGLALLIAGGGLVPTAFAEESSVGSSPDKPTIDVKKVFATSCSWCHDGYGMDAGKGPKLAGTQRTEKQLYDRIWNGKPGAMPAYKKVLTEDQVQALASYIKGLPAN